MQPSAAKLCNLGVHWQHWQQSRRQYSNPARRRKSGAREWSRTITILRSLDFESSASASSATRALDDHGMPRLRNSNLKLVCEDGFERARPLGLRFYYFAPAFRAFAFWMPSLIARRCAAESLRPRSLLPRSLLISISLGMWLIARGA